MYHFLQVGASSMQGWRVSQEDDHNAILDYGEKSAYFAVYDGHGGHEVAKYVADKLPSFIQNRKDFSFGADDDAMTKTLQESDSIDLVIFASRIQGGPSGYTQRFSDIKMRVAF